MKHFFVRAMWPAGVLLALVASCAAPTAYSKPAVSGPPSGLGRLVVNIEAGSSREVLPVALSRDLANTYELVLSDGVSLKTASLKPGEAGTVDVMPGTYRLVLLAGYRRSDTSTVTQLVGSAYLGDLVTVVDGQTTSAAMTLTALDFGWSAPPTLAQGESKRVEAHGATGNPYLGMSLAGTSTTERPRLKSASFWAGYKDFETPTGTPDSWTCGVNLVSSASSGVGDLQFQGAVIVLLTADATSGSLAGKTKYSWKWLNRYDMADDGPLVPLVEKSVTLTPPTTGLSVSVTWG